MGWRKHPTTTHTGGMGEGLQLHTSTQLVLTLVALVGIILYGSFLFNPRNAGDVIPYIMVLVAESFLMLQALITLWTIVSGGYNPRDSHYYHAQVRQLSHSARLNYKDLFDENGEIKTGVNLLPIIFEGRELEIDVFVTCYGEPIDDIRRTAEAARDMIGQHKTYILDDGDSREVKRLAAQLDVDYIRRGGGEGAKAGNINHALARTHGEFFAIFDADFVPKPEFLYETMPFFSDDELAFVQTPQTYDNLHNTISRGAGFMQQVFYKLIQPGKNRFNSAFCVGTNVVFRRSAIDSIGGVYMKSKSEDIWTSLLLHQKGWKSVYTPDVLAYGDAPDSVKAYSKQQLRWATGAMEIFFWHNPLFIRGLKFSQRIQYLSTATWYMQGIAAALLLALPAIQIFFGLTPINLSIAFVAWVFYYLSFYALQVTVASYAMNGFRFETIVLAMASFPIYIKALINGFMARDKAWQATGATEVDSPYNYVIPQILIFLFLVFTEYVGVIKAMDTRALSLTIFWNSLNLLLFAGFLLLASRENRQLKKQARKARRAARRSQRLAVKV